MAISKKFFCFLVVWLTASALLPLSAQQTREVSVEGLIYDLKHPEGDRRKQAAIVLGQNKVREAVHGLIQLTGDTDGSIRLEAVRALVRINDTRALQAYTRLTHDSEKQIQKKAIEGVINMYVVEEGGFTQGLQKVADVLNPFRDDYNPLMVEPFVPVSQDVKDVLAELLFAADTGIRKDAAVALGILRAHSALPTIQQALSVETSDGVKVELIRTLYKIGDPSAGPAIIPLVRDTDKKVHDEAIYTLGQLRVTEAVPLLKELYLSGVEERQKILGIVPVSGSDDLQKKLLEALAYMGDPSCQNLFLEALQDSRDFYRLHAAEGLGRTGESSYLTEVGRRYLQEDSSKVKLAMSFALYQLGREDHLIDLVGRLDQDQAYYYLLELDSQEIQELYPYLRSEKQKIRIRLLEIIGQRGDPSAVPIIEEMMAGPDPELVAAANLAMRRLQSRGISD